MTQTQKIILIVLGFAAVGGIIAYFVFRKKDTQELTTQEKPKTISTGGTGITTSNSGGENVNISDSATNGEGPVYEINWNAWKVGDTLENISLQVMSTKALLRKCSPPSFNDAKGKIITKSVIGQCGAFNSFQLSALNIEKNLNLPMGVFAQINYIDSSNIQVRTSVPTVWTEGTTSMADMELPKFITMNRTDFNTNWYGNIGVQKLS